MTVVGQEINKMNTIVFSLIRLYDEDTDFKSILS